MERVRSVARRDGRHVIPDPRPAVTVVIARDANIDGMGAGTGAGLEVLLIRRPQHMRFAAGVWVFPGGRVDAGETHAEAAVREVAEETALRIDPKTLAPLDWWITPEPETRRFDVRFFITDAPSGQEPIGSPDEVDEWRWIRPAHAIAEDLPMLRPTMSVLARLAEVGAVVDVLAREASFDTLVPRMPRPFEVDDRIVWHVVDASTDAILERDVAMPRWEATP